LIIAADTNRLGQLIIIRLYGRPILCRITSLVRPSGHGEKQKNGVMFPGQV